MNSTSVTKFLRPRDVVLLLRKIRAETERYSNNLQRLQLNHDADSKARAGVVRVVHVITAIHVIDVDVVGVVPT
jgi:hypothetical protein